MEEEKHRSLGEVIDTACWTHNTNVNISRFTPLELLTGKDVTFPGIMNGTHFMRIKG